MPTAITPRKSYKTLMLIWWAMLTSLIIYLIVCRVVGDQVRPETVSVPLDLMRNILLAVSIAELAAVGFFRRRFTAAAGPGDLQKLTVVFIASFAIAESVGLYGLVLYLLGDSEGTLYMFLLISAAALVWFKPERDLFDTLGRGERPRS